MTVPATKTPSFFDDAAPEFDPEYFDDAEFDGPVEAAFAGARDPEGWCGDAGAMSEPGDDYYDEGDLDPDFDWDLQI